ncbi:MAG: electron transport complex subunit RsxC [Burkholderiales bacterium]|nr:electron transport complex subunit RsxC [Burkholderiales bacterium]
MRLLDRFRLRGGVHPPDRKGLSADAPIRRLPVPERLYVSLQQHIGAAASPVVHVGERVLKGQRIAASQGAISAPLHAPTSGRIVAIGDHPAPHPSGLPVPTIVIEADGADRWIDGTPPADPFALPAEEIAARVGAAGIVGLGGATFPAAVKLEVSRKSRVRTLVINGSECEPYLTCDDRLMRERAADIVTGIRLIQQAVGAREALVGIEANKPEAIAAMRAAAGGDLEVVAIPALYPMGWEKQLIRLLTGREVPAGGRAADIGVLVHNVATAYAVQQAVVLGRPLVSRIVTVSGGAVRIPCNLEVPIGAPVQALIDYCGGVTEPPARWVMGGPMMGHEIPATHLPVIKGTSAVLALTAAEIGRPQANPCIRCATCVRACPVGLLPLEMAARIRVGELNAAVEIGLKDCIGCGSCSYVCPSHIPLVHYFNYAKGELAAKERARLKQEATRQLAEARTARLERLAREREEAARARAARKAAQEAARAAARAEATA